MATLQGHEHRIPYSLSKYALTALTRLAAVEWGKDHIQVNTIAPSCATKEAFAEMVKYVTPEGKMLMDELYLGQELGVDVEAAIGGAVSFLCSGDSDWITGRNIFVDGGSGFCR